MIFNYLGHASVLVESNNFKLLLDPWFGFPIHYDTFFADPPIFKPNQAIINSISAIHLSHIHQDHFCKKSLAFFPKNIPIVIAKHKNDFFLKSIKKLGFENIFEVPVGFGGFQIGPFKVFLFLSSVSNTAFDSALVLQSCEDSSQSFYLNNDCYLNPDKLKDLRENFGFFKGCFLSYSEINPFPCCYDMEPLNTIKKIDVNLYFQKNRKQRSLKNFENVIQILRPVWAVPYANSLIFKKPELLVYNRYFNTFIDIKPYSKLTNLIENATGYLKIDSNGNVLTFENDDPNLSQTTFDLFVKEPLAEISDFSKFAADLKSKISTFILASAKFWKSSMSIEFIISNTTFKESFEFNVKTKGVAIYSGNPDISIQLPLEFVFSFLNEDLSFQSIIFTYRVKIKINNYFAEQCLPHNWSN